MSFAKLPRKILKKKTYHGICLPLFSLHTFQSDGGGGFLDLIPLIEWIASLGWDVVQLLPLNDSGKDPSLIVSSLLSPSIQFISP
jgi:4-alpha-glucanotransferase